MYKIMNGKFLFNIFNIIGIIFFYNNRKTVFIIFDKITYFLAINTVYFNNILKSRSK